MATPEQVSFGALLKRSRRAAGLTQEALAERAGYSAIYISKLERGERLPLPPTVELLAGALELAPEERMALMANASRNVAAQQYKSRLDPGSDGTALPLLIGRDHELALIERHLAGEGPPMLLLAGEPGIGKTRLLQHVSAQGLASRFCVLEGGCHRRSGQEPYAPIVGAFAAYIARRSAAELHHKLRDCAWLAHLLPELAETQVVPVPAWSSSSGQERRLMFTAAQRFLTHIAADSSGVLLVLDDLQWAGSDALDLLQALVRGSSKTRIRLVGAYRDTEVSPPDPLSMALADLVRDGMATMVPLGALLPGHANLLLDQLLATDTREEKEKEVQPSAVMRERVLSLAGGVPFYLVNIARGLLAGALDIGSGEADAIPWNVATIIRQRVNVLPQAARELLEAAAIIGRTGSHSVLGDVALHQNWEVSAVTASLEAAFHARLLTEDESCGYQFSHDLIREVIVGDLSAARRADLHGQVGNALERIGGGDLPVDALAYHFTRAGHSEKAIMYLRQAAERADRQYAYAKAEGYYRELVDRLEELGQLAYATRVREQLGVVLLRMANYSAALEVLERAVEQARDGGDLEGMALAIGRLAEVYGSAGAVQEGLARLQPLLSSLGDRGLPTSDLATLYWQLAWLYLSAGRGEEALLAAERSTSIARSAGEQTSLARAEYWKGCALASLGQYSEGFQVFEALVPLAKSAGEVMMLAGAHAQLSNILIDRGELRLAAAHIEQAVTIAEVSAVDLAGLVSVVSDRGQVAFLLGDWSQARADYERALAMIAPVGLSWAAPIPHLFLGELCLAEGDITAASSYLEAASALAERMDKHALKALAQFHLGEPELLNGRAESAQARLRTPVAALQGEEGLLLRASIGMYLMPRLAWIALETGDSSQATLYIAKNIALVRERQCDLPLVEGLRIEALIAMHSHRWKQAASGLEESLTLCRQMSYPYGEAKALYTYGQLLAAQCKPEQACDCYQSALAICVRLGERLYAERIEQVLAELA